MAEAVKRLPENHPTVFQVAFIWLAQGWQLVATLRLLNESAVARVARVGWVSRRRNPTNKVECWVSQSSLPTEKIISIRTGMGARHDMRLARRYLTELYPYKIVIADKGYQGLAKTGLQTPKKKSKHHPPDKQDKEADRRLGKLRTVIGHINRKLKIFKILSLPYRNRRKRFGLRANLIAGLVSAMG